MAKPSKQGWIYVLATFALLAVAAVVLSILYRERPKPTEVLDRKKRANATRVVYAVVFSTVSDANRKRIIEGITADLGADTTHTDFVIGSTVADPWCASMAEYKHQLSKAMSASSPLPIGKQTLILSMIAGFLNKSDLPARIYLIGKLNADDITDRSAKAIATRTEQTVAAMSWRNNARAPVQVISYLDTAANTVTATYAGMFEGKSFTMIRR